jgi:hypothetical protein
VTAGSWLGASYVLGRDVTDTEPYPHICGVDVVGRVTRARFRVWRRDCAACQVDAQPAPQPMESS